MDIEQLAEKLDSLEEKVDCLINEFNGVGSDIGIKTKLHILWRMHVWIFCTGSAAFGSLITLLVQWARNP